MSTSLKLFLHAEDGSLVVKDAEHGLLEVPKFQVGPTHLSQVKQAQGGPM